MCTGFLWPPERGQSSVGEYPANTRRRHNVALLLGQRRRRWANSKPALG